MLPSRILIFWVSIFVVIQLTGCGIQSIPKSENDVDASSAEVTNQYKRRADLVPNLVSTVKGYAQHEEETLVGVTEARAKATAISIDLSKATADQIASYQKAQGQLSQALGRLMVVTEKYPELKADTGFRELQAQLESTENRILAARNGLISSIRDFDNLVTVFPTSLTNSIFFRKPKKAQWNVSDVEKQTNEKPPGVKF
jgi:LemA protein